MRLHAFGTEKRASDTLINGQNRGIFPRVREIAWILAID